MIRYSDEASAEDIDKFVSSLPETFFSHKDVMRCYSIFERNEFHRMARSIPTTQFKTHTTESVPAAPKQRKQRRTWTENEIETLKQGVSRFGKNFSAILKANPSVFGPNSRTTNELEKKYNQLVTKGASKSFATLDGSFAVHPTD